MFKTRSIILSVGAISLVAGAFAWNHSNRPRCPGTYDENGIKNDFESLVKRRAGKWFGSFVPASDSFSDFRFDYSNPKFAFVQFTVNEGPKKFDFYGTYEACGSFELSGGELRQSGS